MLLCTEDCVQVEKSENKTNSFCNLFTLYQTLPPFPFEINYGIYNFSAVLFTLWWALSSTQNLCIRYKLMALRDYA